MQHRIDGTHQAEVLGEEVTERVPKAKQQTGPSPESSPFRSVAMKSPSLALTAMLRLKSDWMHQVNDHINYIDPNAFHRPAFQ